MEWHVFIVIAGAGIILPFSNSSTMTAALVLNPYLRLPLH
jgi:hypothetical protein